VLAGLAEDHGVDAAPAQIPVGEQGVEPGPAVILVPVQHPADEQAARPEAAPHEPDRQVEVTHEVRGAEEAGPGPVQRDPQRPGQRQSDGAIEPAHDISEGRDGHSTDLGACPRSIAPTGKTML